MALLPDRIFNVRIKLRNDSHANWEKQPNFVPMDGEIIIYDTDDEHKFQMIKIGDGSRKLSDLPFINDFYTKEEIDAFIKELQERDKDLQGNINKERVDRIKTDGALQGNINKEKEERKEADNTLQENIDKEKEEREYELAKISYRIDQLHPVQLKDIVQYDGGQLVEIVFDCNSYNGIIQIPK